MDPVKHRIHFAKHLPSVRPSAPAPQRPERGESWALFLRRRWPSPSSNMRMATFEQGTHASVKNTTAYIYIYIYNYIYIYICIYVYKYIYIYIYNYNCILYIWRNIRFPIGYCIPWGKPNNQANDKPSILGKMVVHSMVYTSTVHSAYGTLSIINRHVVGKFWL